MAHQSMITSGETALATTTNDPVNAIVMPSQGFFRNMKNILVVNEGAAVGFVTIDGVTWIRIPAQGSLNLRSLRITSTVQIKRAPGGSDLAGVFVTIW